MNKITSSSSSVPLGNNSSGTDLEHKPDLASFEGRTIQQSQTPSSFVANWKKIASMTSLSKEEIIFQSTRSRSLSEPILPSQTRPREKVEAISILNHNTPLDADEIEGLAYTLSGINEFVNSYQALDVFRPKKQTVNKQKQHFHYNAAKEIVHSSIAPTDAVEIKEIKQRFISAAQAFYGKDVFSCVLNETNQQTIFDSKTAPLTLQQTTEIIAKADSIIQEARGYLKLCPALSIELARAAQAATDDIPQFEKALTQAQKAYAELSPPAQYLLRGTYCALDAFAKKILLATTVTAGTALAGTIGAGITGLTLGSTMAFLVADPIMLIHTILTFYQAPLQSMLTTFGIFTGGSVGHAMSSEVFDTTATLVGAGLGGILSGGAAALDLATWSSVFRTFSITALLGAMMGAPQLGAVGRAALLEHFEESYAEADATLAQAHNEWNKATTAEEEKQIAQALVQEQQEKLQERWSKFRQFFEAIDNYTETLFDRNTPLEEVSPQQAEALTDLVLLRDKLQDKIDQELREKETRLTQQETIKAEQKRVSDRIDQRARFPRGI